MDTMPFLRWLRRPTQTPPLRLQDLPDDVLSRIILTLMNPVLVGPNTRIVEQSYAAALPLSLTSTKFYSLFQQQLIDCELWQSAMLDDRGLIAISRNANTNVRRMVLRKCSRITIHGLHAMSTYCTNLRTIDLSYMDITDHELSLAISGATGTLRSLLIRGCRKLTNSSLLHVAQSCQALEELDVSSIPFLTDAGIKKLARGVGERLKKIYCSECKLLTDDSLESLGRWCPKLEIVTCRGLPLITNEGLDALCSGVRDYLTILDILDCDQLKVKGFLDSARRYCPQLAKRYECAEGKSLRQIIISSLSGFIFHVTGSDIHNGKAAVYFLLVDSGTSNSFRVSIGSSSLDLTNYGAILASCFGESPNEHVKQTLLTLYGLDLDAEECEGDGGLGLG